MNNDQFLRMIEIGVKIAELADISDDYTEQQRAEATIQITLLVREASAIVGDK